MLDLFSEVYILNPQIVSITLVKLYCDELCKIIANSSRRKGVSMHCPLSNIEGKFETFYVNSFKVVCNS